MKIFLRFVFILCFFLNGSLCCAEETFLNDELTTIDHLLEASVRRIEKQTELKTWMALYKEQKTRFIEGKPKGKLDGKLALQMVRSAKKVHAIIVSEHLEHLFSSEYMEELVMFSSIAGKSLPVRP